MIMIVIVITINDNVSKEYIETHGNSFGKCVRHPEGVRSYFIGVRTPLFKFWYDR